MRRGGVTAIVSCLIGGIQLHWPGKDGSEYERKEKSFKEIHEKTRKRQTVCVCVYVQYVYILHQTLFEGILCLQEG